MQNFKNLIIDNPHTLSLLPTHRCTAACENCCFDCSPKIKQQMSLTEMKRLIDETLKTFPSIRVFVVSGGECTLLGDDLNAIIAYANSKGLSTRIVTNAHWANTEDAASRILVALKENGLREINFSTGDNHQKYVPLKNIINATRVAIQLNFSNVIIGVENHPDSKCTEEDLSKHPMLKQYVEAQKLQFISGPWMNFLKSKTDQYEIGLNKITVGLCDRCDKLFQTITINPHSQLLACCGLTVEYNKFLKLGNLQEHSLKELYDFQFNDVFLLWIYTHGSKYIYEKVKSHKGEKIKNFTHPCAYCIEIMNDPSNRDIIHEILQSELPRILFRLEMINKKLI